MIVPHPEPRAAPRFSSRLRERPVISACRGTGQGR